MIVVLTSCRDRLGRHGEHPAGRDTGVVIVVFSLSAIHSLPPDVEDGWN